MDSPEIQEVLLTQYLVPRTATKKLSNVMSVHWSKMEVSKVPFILDKLILIPLNPNWNVPIPIKHMVTSKGNSITLRTIVEVLELGNLLHNLQLSKFPSHASDFTFVGPPCCQSCAMSFGIECEPNLHS